MPGDADEANESFFTRLDHCLQGATFAQRELPLDHVGQVVQLQEVDVVDTQPIEGTVEFFLRPLVVSRVRLRGDEERGRIPLEPRRDPQLRVTIGCRRVDVIHAVLQEKIQRSLGVCVGNTAERRRTEDRASALVAGPTERRLCDH